MKTKIGNALFIVMGLIQVGMLTTLVAVYLNRLEALELQKEALELQNIALAYDAQHLSILYKIHSNKKSGRISVRYGEGL